MTFKNAELEKRSKNRLLELVNQAGTHAKQQALASNSIARPSTPTTTDLAVQSAPATGIELNHPDLQEIKASLAELARAVTVLAAVCNKLEVDATPSTPTAQPLAKVVRERSCMPIEMSGAVPSKVAEHSELVMLKDAASVQSKRARLGK